ncbi:MAG: LysM domain-containing protein [Pelovirga sp.]
MIRTLTCRFTVLVLLLLLAAPAVSPVLAEKGTIYTIQKGDTLWDLSQRFIEDPYYWPNIWADNPDITNPHLIFPGQRIRILDGRIEILPAYAEGERDVPPAVAPEEELLTITAAGRGEGFILVDEEPHGYLVDSVDNRILLTETDQVFISMADTTRVQVGDKFALYQRGPVITHPQSFENVGTLMYHLGSVEVTDVRGHTVVASIADAYREVLRGAELFDFRPPQRDIALRRGTTRAPGFIVAAQDEKGTMSTNDIIYIDLGSSEDLAVGNLFHISRPRQLSSEALATAAPLDLPDAVLGAAIVTEVRESTATAIIIKSVDAATVGDRVTVVTD